jgi:3-methyladenine DNA glycosylase AlkD
MTRNALIERIKVKVKRHRARSTDYRWLRELTLRQLKRELRHEKQKAFRFYPLLALLGLR